MAANPKKGHYGQLKDPQTRMARLKTLAHLPLKEAAKALGVGTERVRQLYRLYGVERTHKYIHCRQHPNLKRISKTEAVTIEV